MPLVCRHHTLDGQLASTPNQLHFCMASYQGLYAKFISISLKCSIVENDGEFMELHEHFLPQQQYSRVYALFSASHALVYWWGCGTTHWMVNWFQLLNQLHFVWRHTKVFMQNSFQWCLRNVQSLRMMANWWRFTHTFCHSSNILGYTHFHALVYWWDASFFHFFHKITNIRSWWCFFSSKFRKQFWHTFCNITMIFKVMFQYFLALFKRIHNHICSEEG